MTTQEFEGFTKILMKLFPRLAKDWNDEIGMTWHRVCGNYPVGVCIAEVRGLSDRLKYPARPYDLREALERRRQREESGRTTSTKKEQPSQTDLYRQWMEAGGMFDRMTIEAMPDAQVQLEWDRALFVQASNVYAPVIKGVDYRGVPVPDLERDGVYVSPTLRVSWDRFQASQRAAG